jgi:hypothetical protein
LALALHLVLHELAANAKKYGALSSALGRVKIEWKVRHVLGAPRKLAIVWTEHGGPEVQRPRHRGFGSRLIKRALDGYGGVRLDFNRTGFACFMADRSRSPRRANTGAGRIITLSRQTVLAFDDIMFMPKSVTAAPIPDYASEQQ